MRDLATISIVDRGGISVSITSRVDTDPVLKGTKHRVATERSVLVTKGRRDDRLIMLVPEVKDTQPVGITLLHLKLVDSLTADDLRTVLQSYRNRYVELRDAVLETEASFDESMLGEIPLQELLIAPALVLADRWRTGT